MGERKSSSLCMHVCMYLCKVVVGKRYACKCILLCASHGNAMRACTNAILSGPCNAWLMIDGWMIVMNGSGDAWFVLVKE